MAVLKPITESDGDMEMLLERMGLRGASVLSNPFFHRDEAVITNSPGNSHRIFVKDEGQALLAMQRAQRTLPAFSQSMSEGFVY